MAKVVLWGISESMKKSLPDFEEYCSRFNFIFQIGNVKDSSVLEDCFVLLYHDNDFPDLNSYKDIDWKLLASGRILSSKINVDKKSGGMSPSCLTSNLEKFLIHINTKTEILKDDISVLLGLDLKLESLLMPFSNISPLEFKKFDRKKKELETYINLNYLDKD